MTKHTQSIQAFSALGNLLNDYTFQKKRADGWIEKIDDVTAKASNQNKWFTKENLDFCMSVWGKTLNEKDITEWLANYADENKPTRLALVLAGNIPLVGLHDVLCGLASGCSIEAKLSSNDNLLLPLVIDFLVSVMPNWKDKVCFIESSLKTYDKVIATGSDNSARYFEYYFKNNPHIIRKTRNGIAVLDGNETQDDLAALSQDMMQYFGLGCRSVSHIMVPDGYDFKELFSALFEHKELIQHNAYANNYDYNKAVYLMQEQKFLENGFIILKKDDKLSSPIACVNYSAYTNLEAVNQRLHDQEEQIQCVVSNCVENAFAFGQTQYPKLGDYADHVDTMAFLLKK